MKKPKIKLKKVLKCIDIEKWRPAHIDDGCYSPTPIFDWAKDEQGFVGGALHELLHPKNWKKNKKYKITIEEI